jgi:hypothetical protein
MVLWAVMSLKLHLLYSNLDFFPRNMGVISDEHGEKFHNDISQMEKRYGRKNGAQICWLSTAGVL